METMDAGDLFRLVFLAAFLASLGVYIWRAYRLMAHKETRADRAARRAGLVAGEGGDDMPGAAPTGAEGVTASLERGRRAGRPTSPPLPAAEEAFEEGSLVQQVIREEIEKRQRLEAGEDPDIVEAAATAPETQPGRHGLFAKEESAVPPVIELVAGIRLPCDLVPFMTSTAIDPHRVLFLTTGHPAAAVASALADELERLGFSLRTIADDEVIASRTNDATAGSAAMSTSDGPGTTTSPTPGDLRVHVFADAGVVLEDGAPRFPLAPQAGVVVELLAERRKRPR